MMTGLFIGGAIFALVGLIIIAISAMLDSDNGLETGLIIMLISSIYVVILAIITAITTLVR